MTGKSDGAGFAASVACGDSQVAAVAMISGAFYEAENHWPGAGVSSGPGTTSRSVDAAQVISAFFADHPLS